MDCSYKHLSFAQALESQIEMYHNHTLSNDKTLNAIISVIRDQALNLKPTDAEPIQDLADYLTGRAELNDSTEIKYLRELAANLKKGEPTVLSLPQEIVLNIQEYVIQSNNPKDYKNLSETNRLFDRLSRHPFAIQLYLDTHKKFKVEQQVALLEKTSDLSKISLYFNEEGFDSNRLSKLLKQSPNLKELSLINCPTIQDDLLAVIGTLSHLTKLDLSYCSHITDEGLAHLKGLNRLIKLNLSYCLTITDKGIESLQSLSQLQELTLRRCLITGSGFASLNSLRHLRVLHLTDCKQITSLGFECLAVLRQLEEVNLLDCSQLSDSHLIALSPIIKTLSRLTLTCTQLTDQGLEALKGSKLTSLRLINCIHLTDKSASLIGCLEQLEDLTLSKNDQLTDRTLSYFSNLSHLKTLIIDKTESMTVKGFSYLGELSHLLKVDIRRSKGLPESDRENLKALSPSRMTVFSR